MIIFFKNGGTSILQRANPETNIEYEPLSVREILKKIKDISSLMVDLAYFAYVNENKELADLVMDLEKKVDQLVYLLYINASLATRDKDDAMLAAAIIKIGSALNEFANAAADVANLIRIGLPPHRYIKEAFERTEEIVDDVTIEANSVLVGKKLADIENLGIYIDAIALKRNGKWILNPAPDTILSPGDVLIVRGNIETLEKFKKVCSSV